MGGKTGGTDQKALIPARADVTRSALIPLRSISKHMAMISFRKPYFASFMWHSLYNKHPLPEITYPPSRMILRAKLVLT
jgi:hypothetical protein